MPAPVKATPTGADQWAGPTIQRIGFRLISGTRRPRARQGRRIASVVASLALLLALAIASPAVGASSPSLDARLASARPGDRIPVIATLRAQIDGTRYEGHPAALIRALQRTAERTQQPVVDQVAAPVRSFWLVNAVAFDGTPDEIRAVADDPAVAAVDLDTQVSIGADATVSETPFPDAGAGDWGLGAIRVPSVWSAFGLSGAGVRIGTIDTGVDASNPDLAGKVVAWHDFVGSGAAPYDDNGHGTHTAGTMVGGRAGGAPIGVAPDARLVVAKAIGANGSGSGSALLAAAEWMTNPDGDPATPDQPAVINNSWSAPNANDTWFRPMVRRWLELGIVPVFAAGNTGPAAGSIGSPAGYPEALAVGALDTDGTVPSFSARGPVTWQDPDGTGPAAGTVLAKPDLVAPGVGIVSSVGSGYLAYTGTSMAAPHVSGVAALVAQANPSLRGAAIEDLLRATAVPLGAPGADPAAGRGRVDALQAVEAAVGPAPDTRFAVTPSPVTNATVLRYVIALVGGGVTVRTRVDGGPWSEPTTQLELSLPLPEGRHVVEAQAMDAAGVADPTPARHVVLVDRTPPKLSVRLTRRGTETIFTGHARDRLSGTARGSIRWSFGEGETARGARVSRSFAEARDRRVVLTARDAAGNEAFAVRSFRPRAATAVRGLEVRRRAARRSGTLTVRGRLVRPAGIRVVLRPLRPTALATALRGPAAAFAPERLGPPRARAVLPAARPGRFRLTVPIGRLRPGPYRLWVSAPERGSRVGRLRIVRRIEIR